MIDTPTGDAVQAADASPGPHGTSDAGPVSLGWGSHRSRWVIPLVLLLGLIPLGFAWRLLMRGEGSANEALVYYTVRRGTLPITVTERGNLESQNTEEIICEVENFGGDRSGITGTQILFIVPNGSEVKKGDLLVELDSAPLKERLDSQYLAMQRAEAEKIQAISKYENQITQNETDLAEAELKLELAELDLKNYDNDEQGGTFQIELQDIEMEIQTARAQQMIFKSDRDAIDELHKLGYKSKGDFEAARLDYLKASSNLASQLANARQLQDYIFKMETLTLQGKYDTAERTLAQVKLNNESELAQAKAAQDSAIRAYDKEKERHDRYTEQLEMCKIYAPQSGMVAYSIEPSRRGSSTVIEEGAFVRQRQKILTIPDLSSMQVGTAVHESVLDQVHPGLQATVRVDAFPEARYQGSIKSVAVLPDQGGWFSSDTKVYKTVVTIDEEVRQLKPGMTAVVEIDIEQLHDVVSVPIQAIIQRGKANSCFVKERARVQRREVQLGKTNDKFVEIRQGLQEGEVVVLNPLAMIEDESETKPTEEQQESRKDVSEKLADQPREKGREGQRQEANDREPPQAEEPRDSESSPEDRAPAAPDSLRPRRPGSARAGSAD